MCDCSSGSGKTCKKVKPDPAYPDKACVCQCHLLENTLANIDDGELREVARQKCTPFSSNARDQACFALGFEAGFKYLFGIVGKKK